MTGMTGMTALPMEVLHAILSDQALQISDLFNCSLVCRFLGEAASLVLYSHVDLSIDDRYNEDDDEKSTERQLQLLRSISNNPKLAACVNTFKNHQKSRFGEFQDATWAAESTMLVRAAKHMNRLSKASLTASALAGHIITTLPSYTNLIYLTVSGLKPQEHIWNMAPVNLTSLVWDIPVSSRFAKQSPWNDFVQFLVNVVEATCPCLESLEISMCETYDELPTLPTTSAERAQQYCKEPSTELKLTKLRHFGFQYSYSENDIDKEFLDFIKKHQKSLKSVSIPAHLPFVLNVCNSLPDLKDLRLGGRVADGTGNVASGVDFLRALTATLASPSYSIESFCFADIGCPFSPAIAQLFKPLTNLKFLQVGDDNNRGGRYADDGRLDCEGYGPDLLAFIEGLPASLEELYLEINGEGLSLDEDEDFDPICDLGREIFTSLPRLHTCDIHAWISNCDGGLGQYPEKAVFYRRLPHQNSEGPERAGTVEESKIKDVWTSRMDCIYQEDDATVTADFEVVELGAEDGEFEGKDATEVWCDGFTSDHSGYGATGRGRPEDSPSYAWPFWVNKVESYPMFRNNIQDSNGFGRMGT